MLSATCCKTIPFIFPLIVVKHCFKTKKRKINTICSVSSPLPFLYFTTLELGCIKNKQKKINISRHQGGLAQRSFTSTGTQHHSQDTTMYLENKASLQHKFSMFSHSPVSPRTHFFSSRKVKEVWLPAGCYRGTPADWRLVFHLPDRFHHLERKQEKVPQDYLISTTQRMVPHTHTATFNEDERESTLGLTQPEGVV